MRVAPKIPRAAPNFRVSHWVVRQQIKFWCGTLNCRSEPGVYIMSCQESCYIPHHLSIKRWEDRHIYLCIAVAPISRSYLSYQHSNDLHYRISSRQNVPKVLKWIINMNLGKTMGRQGGGGGWGIRRNNILTNTFARNSLMKSLLGMLTIYVSVQARP